MVPNFHIVPVFSSTSSIATFPERYWPRNIASRKASTRLNTARQKQCTVVDGDSSVGALVRSLPDVAALLEHHCCGSQFGGRVHNTRPTNSTNGSCARRSSARHAHTRSRAICTALEPRLTPQRRRWRRPPLKIPASSTPKSRETQGSGGGGSPRKRDDSKGTEQERER